MARTWTQVKSEKHALGLTDATRIAQLKRQTLDEREAATSGQTVRGVDGKSNEARPNDVAGPSITGNS